MSKEFPAAAVAAAATAREALGSSHGPQVTDVEVPLKIDSFVLIGDAVSPPFPTPDSRLSERERRPGVVFRSALLSVGLSTEVSTASPYISKLEFFGLRLRANAS